MNHQDYCQWIDEGRGVFSFGICGVSMRVEGGTQWDVCLPVGTHQRGTADSTDQAKQLAFMAFVAFAVKQLVAHKVNLPPDPVA